MFSNLHSVGPPAEINIADEAGGTTSYTVALATAPTGPVTVAVASGDQTVATVSPSSLSFTTSNWNTAQTITATAVDNDIDDMFGRTTTITHTASGGGYNSVSGTVSVRVGNNETATLRVYTSSLSAREGGSVIQHVWITSQPTGNVKVALTNQHPTVVTVDKDTLRFTPSKWDTTHTVTFTGVDNRVDNLMPSYLTATITLTASGADYEGKTHTMRVRVFGAYRQRTLTEGSSDTLSLTPIAYYPIYPSIVIRPTSSDPDVVSVRPTELTWTQATSGTSYDIIMTAVENTALGNGFATISLPLAISPPPPAYIPFRSYQVTVTDNDVSGPPSESPPISSVPPSSFENLFPAFADTALIADLVAEVRQPIEPQTLPKATGGDNPLTYSLLGNLPEGLVFHADTRRLQGTPTAVTDSAEAMIYRVRDANYDADSLLFTITVTPPDLKPTFGDATIAPLVAEVDQAVAWPLPEATGGDGPLRYSLWDLPDGLALNAVQRQLVGAATMTDTTVATYAATDADGDAATLPFPITIIPPDLKPTFGDATIADLVAKVDQAIDPRTLPEAIGGNLPLTYNLSNLPAGLAFNADSRQLVGAATAPDTTVATYAATDADGDAATLTFSILIAPSDLQPTFGDATIEPLAATACQSVARLLPAATGGDGPLRYSLSNLPVGLAFNADSRQLGGAATATDTTVATYAATDADGDAATLPFTITVQMDLDAPDWLRAENYLGADGTGGWDGSVLLTWALLSNHALLDAYRIYREVQMTHSTDEHGRLVALAEPRDEFVPWARVDAVLGVSVGSAIVGTLDYRATRWAIAAECGGQRTYLRITAAPNGFAPAKAVASEARPHPKAALLPEAFAYAQQAALAPAALALGPNYPNPFNPTTTIQYALPQAAEVRLTVHNALGQTVRTLVAEHQPAGRYAVPYDGRTDHGRPLSAGVYFYRLQAGSVSVIEKMVLLK